MSVVPSGSVVLPLGVGERSLEVTVVECIMKVGRGRQVRMATASTVFAHGCVVEVVVYFWLTG